MMMFARHKTFIALCVAFCWAAQTCDGGIPVLDELLTIKEAYETLDGMVQGISNSSVEDKMFAKFADLSATLHRTERTLQQSVAGLSQAIVALGEHSEFRTRMMGVRAAINGIRAKLSAWETVAENHTVLNARTIFSMAEGSVSYGLGIQTDLSNLQLLVAGDERPETVLLERSFPQMILDYFQVCGGEINRPAINKLFQSETRYWRGKHYTLMVNNILFLIIRWCVISRGKSGKFEVF